jgi:hypothetical protein
VNKKTFERIHATHTAWEADELEEGAEAGREWAESKATYPDLLIILRDLPAAERILQGGEASPVRLPELIGGWWLDLGVDEVDASLAFQVGFYRGTVEVLAEYETELAKQWETPRPVKERRVK